MEVDKLALEAFKKDQGSIVVLTGKAPEQHNPQPVNISGNIDTPSRFIEGRGIDFKESQRHCFVSKTNGTIVMILNEQSIVNRYVVCGKIEVGKKFEKLGINKDNVCYSPEELANKFKLLRAMFYDNMEHATICGTLRNLKAKINKDIEKLDDRKGNVTANFQQTVQSNMPDAITLKIPLLEGGDPVEIEVSVILEADGASQIKCYLESIEAAELIEQLFEKRVNEEIEKIKDFVTIIEH